LKHEYINEQPQDGLLVRNAAPKVGLSLLSKVLLRCHICLYTNRTLQCVL
jgi:hypothetical protein